MHNFEFYAPTRVIFGKGTEMRTGEKRAYNDNLARPKFAVMNPELRGFL